MPADKHIHIYTDGGARCNPGPAAAGGVLYDSSLVKLAEFSNYIGETTNNVAEYLGVIYGFWEARLLGATRVTLYVDSQLIARQIKREYKVKDPDLKIFCNIAVNFMGSFKEVKIVEIPREKNRAADALVNKALDIAAAIDPGVRKAGSAGSAASAIDELSLFSEI